MQMGMELDLFLGNGNGRYAGLTNAGLLDPAVIGAINLGTRSPTPSQLVFPWLFWVAVPHLWSLVGLLLPRVPSSSLGW